MAKVTGSATLEEIKPRSVRAEKIKDQVDGELQSLPRPDGLVPLLETELPAKIRFPVDRTDWPRVQDRTREIGASDAIETAKAAVKKAVTGMAAHWRMAFSAAKATKGDEGIKGVSLNVLSYPKLPVISNGDPSFSLDSVYGHHDGLYVGLTIKAGPFAGLPVDVNFDTGEVGLPRGTISDRWGDTYSIEQPYPMEG